MKHITKQELALANVYTAIHQSCQFSNKITYKKRRDAQSEASRLNKMMPMRGRIVYCEAYECQWCGNWHVGRPSK
jgi:hypothetical protein